MSKFYTIVGFPFRLFVALCAILVSAFFIALYRMFNPVCSEGRSIREDARVFLSWAVGRGPNPFASPGAH